MTSRVAKVLVLVTFLVVACTRNSPTVSHSTPSIQAGKITWADCGGGFQCGTLQVPLDYTHPTARMITLALIRKPATDKSTRIGSVLMNPGGPGESGIEFLRGENNKTLRETPGLAEAAQKVGGLSTGLFSFSNDNEDIKSKLEILKKESGSLANLFSSTPLAGRLGMDDDDKKFKDWVDFSLLFGTICFFGTLFLLFLKFLPAVAVSEVKELNHELHGHRAHPGPEGAHP